MVLIFHAEVCPIPISVSPTQGDFLPAEIAWPMSPDTFSSFVVYSSLSKLTKRAIGSSYLHVKSCIKSHFQKSLIVFIEQTQETLLEDGGGERI
jgi:hypothetical protein